MRVFNAEIQIAVTLDI